MSIRPAEEQPIACYLSSPLLQQSPRVNTGSDPKGGPRGGMMRRDPEEDPARLSADRWRTTGIYVIDKYEKDAPLSQDAKSINVPRVRLWYKTDTIGMTSANDMRRVRPAEPGLREDPPPRGRGVGTGVGVHCISKCAKSAAQPRDPVPHKPDRRRAQAMRHYKQQKTTQHSTPAQQSEITSSGTVRSETFGEFSRSAESKTTGETETVSRRHPELTEEPVAAHYTGYDCTATVQFC
ncbi:hypothetical protein Tco_1314120 [Tanacetum coccineum]